MSTTIREQTLVTVSNEVKEKAAVNDVGRAIIDIKSQSLSEFRILEREFKEQNKLLVAKTSYNYC